MTFEFLTRFVFIFLFFLIKLSKSLCLDL